MPRSRLLDLFTRSSSKEKAPVDPVEAETLRVIKEHLGTVYSIISAHDPEEDKILPPEKVEKHIRDFFALIDERIDWIAETDIDQGKQTFMEKDIQDFKVMMRKVYQVATTNDCISAIETGTQAALELADNDPNAIIVCGDNRKGSRELFYNDARMILSKGARRSSQDKTPPKAILILDDVSHSGSQLKTAIQEMSVSFPQASIVVSVGMITTRAQEKIQPELNENCVVFFTKKAECLRDLVEAIKSSDRRKRISQLIEAYASSINYDLDEFLLATHIITPSKLPDSVSNGQLGYTKNLYGRMSSFTLKEPYLSSAMYPNSH